MDSFGIDRLALPKFGIDVFRLPNFGQTSNGASKGRFHESLVDAWFMSGYKNGDAPSGIRGVKGNVITLHNFLFAGNSGFGKYSVNKTTWINTNRCERIDVDYLTYTFVNITENYNLQYINGGAFSTVGNIVKVKVTGIPKGGVVNIGNYITNITEDGVYEGSYTYDNNGNTSISSVGCIGDTITVEFLPDNEGALCFDGVDDYAVLQNTGFTAGTVILGYYDYDKTSARWKYFYDANVVRTYAGLNASQDMMAGINATDKTDKDGVLVVNYTKGANTLSAPLYIGTKTELTEFMGMSLKYFAVYSEPLTTEQIEEEKVKLENKWESKLNKS